MTSRLAQLAHQMRYHPELTTAEVREEYAQLLRQHR